MIMHRVKSFRRTAYWWWRLMNHRWFRFDDNHIRHNFWVILNSGYYDMNYEWQYKNTCGKK